MKISKIYHFLGSVYFALILIAAAALFVILGTLIESHTRSHLYAAQFTYSNPLFIMVLWGFFINIFLSALRRRPFKVRHIPFLTTHFGLLMILGGILIKVYFGVQGTMKIMEGAASHRILKANTYVVQAEKRGEQPYSYSLDKINKSPDYKEQGLSLELVNYLPNSSDRLATWIKGTHATIQGLSPMPMLVDENETDEILPSGKVQFYQNSPPWEIYAIRTNNIQESLNKLCQQGALLKFNLRASGVALATLDLSTALNQPVVLKDEHGVYGEAKVHLNLVFSDNEGINEDSALEIEAYEAGNGNCHKVKVPLRGDLALLNLNKSTPYLGSSPITVDIIRAPLLAFIEDQCKDTHMVSFDARGQVWSHSFGNDHLHSYIAYEEGFGGYAVQSNLPFPNFLCGREQREAALFDYLAVEMRQAVSKQPELSPPLKLLQNACHKGGVDFIETLILFLRQWDNQHSWLYAEGSVLPKSMEIALKHINWQQHPQEACQQTVLFFDLIKPDIDACHHLIEALRKNNWPLMASCERLWKQEQKSIVDKTGSLMTLLTQQIFSIDDQLIQSKNESERVPMTCQQHARLLSAYLRAYDIHLSTIIPMISDSEIKQLIQKKESVNSPLITLETPLAAILEEAPISSTLEDNIPAITLRVQKGNLVQTISLAYDSFAQGLKWPILQGEYLLRFQPRFLEIPYSVRLRHARQINYANSQQAFSYESAIIITDLRSHENTEKTISMNQVHETWDGYRFYLSNISPSDESSVKHIQVVVNHDPAKYWLTYPGAIILSLGIILLFWMRPYRKKKEEDFYEKK
jgi:hypothetical protein